MSICPEVLSIEVVSYLKNANTPPKLNKADDSFCIGNKFHYKCFIFVDRVVARPVLLVSST